MKLKRLRAPKGYGFPIRLPDFNRPAFTDTLRFPEDLTVLSDANVSELLGKYTMLYAYAAQERSRAYLEELKADQELSQVEAGITSEAPQIQHIERWKRDAILASYPEIQKARMKQFMAVQRKEIAGTYASNYDRYVQALSRELTRKTAFSDRHSAFNSSRTQGA